MDMKILVRTVEFILRKFTEDQNQIIILGAYYRGSRNREAVQKSDKSRNPPWNKAQSRRSWRRNGKREAAAAKIHGKTRKPHVKVGLKPQAAKPIIGPLYLVLKIKTKFKNEASKS